MIGMLRIFIVFSLIPFPFIDAACTHLPSGSCFVDCTQNIYAVVCEDVSDNQLQADLQAFAGLNTSFALHIWNSPAIQRLGGASFSDVQSLVTEIELQNLRNLSMFPEITALSVLKSLIISNAPKMDYFPVELVSPSVEKILFRATGIAEFYTTDSGTGSILPNLQEFRVREQNVSFLNQYFTAFPNVTIIEMSNCHVKLGEMDSTDLPFVTIKPLKEFVIFNNTFESTNLNFYSIIFLHIVNSLTVDESSSVEISQNAFPIGKKTLENFGRLSPIRRLSLRGSYFENFNTLENLFLKFNNLVYLDLGHTNLPIYKLGTFRGLPSVEVLLLDGNGLHDIESRDFFNGFIPRNLSVLDVSDNGLIGHIWGFEQWAANLEWYNLAGNTITQSLFTNRSQYFPKLRFMSQARNRRTYTKSANYKSMTQLNTIDFGCNDFRNITKEYFNDLPASLKVYNLSFCERKQSDRVMVAKDAFTGFPAISELYLDRAFLKPNFFAKLQRMPKTSAQALRVLHLAYNRIAFLHGEGSHFIPFTGLEYLDLEGNLMQSTGAAAFSPLKRLRRLNLSKNGLFSIGQEDFKGLDSLEDLDLSGNSLTLIAPKSFDMLGNLRGLFLHDNALTKSSGPVAVITPGECRKLTHFSMANIPYDCLDTEVFVRFPGLKWVYLNNSVPLFADMDPRLSMLQQMQRTPLHPWARLRMCDSGTFNPRWNMETAFVKVVVNDVRHSVYQDLYLLFNTCFQRHSRQIRNIVEKLLC
ncbi:protein artichoke-like [Paramacrobiotus metropolitanus]|uniref:protein artichoke-like n=1 Tax=Paramacrobiotus metropolitanus TaxID=2943436 RepID=UPI0024455EC1|nr:protein artichoke-like [Paramacrobiotus metropolitanus]